MSLRPLVPLGHRDTYAALTKVDLREILKDSSIKKDVMNGLKSLIIDKNQKNLQDHQAQPPHLPEKETIRTKVT